MSERLDWAAFDTAIGACALAWGERGIVRVFLPEDSETSLRTRIRRLFPEAHEASPPTEIGSAIEAIAGLLRGEARELRDVALDMREVPPFEQRVYEVARSIGPGRTLSYGEIATRLGGRELARDVGQALARNPFPIVVPCHRVVGANGKLGGFSARGGVATKDRLLAIEGARVTGLLPLFDRADSPSRA